MVVFIIESFSGLIFMFFLLTPIAVLDPSTGILDEIIKEISPVFFGVLFVISLVIFTKLCISFAKKSIITFVIFLPIWLFGVIALKDSYILFVSDSLGTFTELKDAYNFIHKNTLIIENLDEKNTELKILKTDNKKSDINVILNEIYESNDEVKQITFLVKSKDYNKNVTVTLPTSYQKLFTSKICFFNLLKYNRTLKIYFDGKVFFISEGDIFHKKENKKYNTYPLSKFVLSYNKKRVESYYDSRRKANINPMNIKRYTPQKDEYVVVPQDAIMLTSQVVSE